MKRIFCLICFLTLISGCTTLKTPEIKGVVLDAETGQPIGDARIYAKWERMMRGFGGEYSGGIEKERHLKTKGDGTFLIPARTMINFIPSPIGKGGNFFMIVYAHGYKYSRYFFFETRDFERPSYKEFEDVIKGKKLVLRMARIEDPKTFIKNGGEVFRFARTDKEFELKEDQLFVERFGRQKWDIDSQYELAATYYRLGDYKSALKKLDEILEINPNEKKVRYFQEKYGKYKSKLTESKNKN